MLVAENDMAKVAWPKKVGDLVGSGGTHGEFAVRFPLEDLREPIIKDNLLDDDILQEHIRNNRLEQWFEAALRAGKKDFVTEQRQARRSSAPQIKQESAVSQINGASEAEAVLEAPASNTFEGDIERVADQDEKDVEMQDS
jgi:nuclear pore complex protein Nup133